MCAKSFLYTFLYAILFIYSFVTFSLFHCFPFYFLRMETKSLNKTNVFCVFLCFWFLLEGGREKTYGFHRSHRIIIFNFSFCYIMVFGSRHLNAWNQKWLTILDSLNNCAHWKFHLKKQTENENDNDNANEMKRNGQYTVNKSKLFLLK